MKQRNDGQAGAMRAGRVAGFTLIEIMVVVAIIGIIAAIAWPNYTQYVTKGRREAGKTCLLQAAQQMERFYTTSLAYNASGSPAAFACPEAAAFYTLGVSNLTARGYTLSATPQGSQLAQDTRCGTLSINAAGTRSPTTSGCW